jgi:hypothetical protein
VGEEQHVPETEDAPDADFEQASEKLSQGLKTCRAVIRNYRHMLAADEPAPDAAERLEEPAK